MPLRFELPAGLREVHRLTVQLRWGDMDPMGHVNNTLYFRYMEMARLDWLLQWGVETTPRSGDGPVIVNAFCNFLRQLAHPGNVVVSSHVGDVGRSSFDSYHRIERSDQPGVVWAEGGARIVWTDYAAQRSLPLPEPLRRRLLVL